MSKSRYLQPTTPTFSTRYDSCNNVVSVHRTVPSYAEDPRPTYLPPFCQSLTNPEGKLYFVTQTQPRFITEQSMYDAKTQERMLLWQSVFLEVLKEKQVTLAYTVEVYLNPSEDGETCLYYLVNHETKVLSWLEPVATGDIGLKPAVSDDHSRFQLEELYWNHIEYYPSHECDVIDLRMDELISVLIQCRTDQLTSEDSTFPFSAQKCQDFLDVVRSCKELQAPECARIRWSLARIWALVCNHRFMTHYGQEKSRLTRDQTIMDVSRAQEWRMFALWSRLLFNIPALYNNSFESLYADEIIYQDEWRDFAPKCRDDWMLSTMLSFAVLICNLLMLNSSSGSRILSGSSTAVSAAAVLSGSILLTQHQRSGSWTAGQAASYLSCARNKITGFQGLACQFSLPRALLLWALGIFSIQTPFIFSDMTDNCILVVLGTITVLGFMVWLSHLLLTYCWAFFRNVRNWRIFKSRLISLDETLPC